MTSRLTTARTIPTVECAASALPASDDERDEQPDPSGEDGATARVGCTKRSSSEADWLSNPPEVHRRMYFHGPARKPIPESEG